MSENRVSEARQLSPWAVIDAASAFFRMACHFTDSLPNDLDEAANHAAKHFGELVASATNVILAVELYLKAVLIGAELPVPRTHDLVKLFDCLPPNWQSALKARYEERRSSSPRLLSGLQVAVQLSQQIDQKDLKNVQVIGDTRLNALLDRNRSAFVTWRYIHEGMKNNKVEVYDYEFRSLQLVCQILHEALTASLPRPNPGAV